MRLSRRSLVPLITLALPIVLVAIAVGHLDNLPYARAAIDWIRSIATEWWAVPVFLTIYAIFTLFFLPVSVLSAASALAWGWKIGGAIEIVACTLSALPPFLLARRGLSPRLTRFLDRRGVVLDPLPPGRETFVLFILRILTIVPYVAVNYIAGLARIRTREYVGVTFLGSLPSIFIFAWFVDTVGSSAGATGQFRVWIACGVLALVAILTRKAAARWRERHTAPPPDAADPRCASPAPRQE